MEPSNRIIEFIKGYEKCRLKAFMPTPNDKPTIGWGATGADIKLGMVWTQQQADERFVKDMASFADDVNHILYDHPCTQGQFDALVSFAYNEGSGNLRTSTLLRKHKSGDYEGAAAEFAKWNKQRSKTTGNLEVLDGLTKRRAAEAAIYKEK